MTPDQRLCQRGHPMAVVWRFRFDHALDDTLAVTARLERLQRAGLELGADVTVWRCGRCEEVEALFRYPDGADGP
jgi:hypothetical protein